MMPIYRFVFGLPLGLALLLSFLLVPIQPLVLLVARQRLRRRLNLEGGPTGDVACLLGSCCCVCCLMQCQVVNQIQAARRSGDWEKTDATERASSSEELKSLDSQSESRENDDSE
ncbi:unnamed protein product [Protopolystoma xenopodis]|uniref:Uncharacterized protein n=1 Tax=Protopolystoma xenopodis TaxID=117903 RepID=A0A3S5AJN1_9PLAT|nr:unnamed protein product [Protopolystoma xenopodis]